MYGKKTSFLRRSVSVLVAGVTIFLSAFLTSCSFVEAVKQNSGTSSSIKLENFSASENCFILGEENEVIFTVEAKGAVLKTVDLYCDNKKTAKMTDDGKNGDATANDGIYTYVLKESVQGSGAVTKNYECRVAKVKSSALNLFYFAPLTEESAAQTKEACESLSSELVALEESFAGDDGYVPEDKKADFVSSALDVIEQNDNVYFSSVSENNELYIKFDTGLSSFYAAATPGTDNVGSDVEMTVITAQPSFTEMGGSSFTWNMGGYTMPEGINYILEMPDRAATDVDSAFPNYSFYESTNLDDEAVTLDAVKSFGANQVILWHGHGFFAQDTGPCLVTGEAFDWNAWNNDPEYQEDCQRGRIINYSAPGRAFDLTVISSEYIDHYCGDMQNSFVYLAACSSGRTLQLADAFTTRGAAVVANDNTIRRTYNVSMLYTTVQNMMELDPATQQYNTLERALELAKEEYGADDSDPRYGGIGAEPLVFGGEAAENYRFATEVPTGTLSGKVCKASDRVTAIPDASVKVYMEGTLMKDATTPESGNYQMELPRGNYQVYISARGYIPFRCNADVNANFETYMETFLMVEGDEDENLTGIATGTVYNSLTGAGVGDVTLKFTKGWNTSEGEVLEEITTNSDGSYRVILPLGNYTVTAVKEGFSESLFNIVVQKTPTDNQDGTITPAVNGNSYLITLTWDEHPRDVDSHMYGNYSDEEKFHVYFGHKSSGKYEGVEVCNLDYDDTTSYGPEHITLNALSTEPYYYFLHKYAGQGALSNSGAKVTVEQGNVVLAEFHMPTDQGDADYWNVFAIVDGRIIVQNTVTSSPDVEYAQAG